MDDKSNHAYVAEVNLAIELYNYCKEFRVLPREGGLFEQDAYIMLLLQYVSVAVNEKMSQTSKPERGPR